MLEQAESNIRLNKHEKQNNSIDKNGDRIGRTRNRYRILQKG